MMPNQVDITYMEWMMSIRNIILLYHIAPINVIGLCDRSII